MSSSHLLLLVALLPAAVAKGPCTDYFGKDVNSSSTTGERTDGHVVQRSESPTRSL